LGRKRLKKAYLEVHDDDDDDDDDVNLILKPVLSLG
jgi:hypothetical protein